MITLFYFIKKFFLEIPQWIALRIFNIIFYIHPESKYEIKNNRRAQGKKRNVNKISPDGGSGNAHFFANSSTNTKYLPFDEVLKFIHIAKLN